MGNTNSGRRRSFSYAEARRLRWVEHHTVNQVATTLGVHPTTIHRACSAKRRAYEAAHGQLRQTRARGTVGA